MKNQIRYDIRAGILHGWWRYLCVAILMMLLFGMQLRGVKEVGMSQMYEQDPSLGNYIVKWMQGMKPIVNSESVRQVVIPSEWIVLQITYILLLSWYPNKDLSQNGYRLFLSLGKKDVWWNGKCIWVFLSTLLYYTLFFCMMLVVAAISGSISLVPTSGLWIGSFRYEGNLECIIMTFVLPVFASFTIGLAQITIELMTSPLIAMIGISGYLLASAYWCNPFLLGNYSMFYRNSYYIGSGGVNTFAGMMICVILEVSAYVTGRIYMQHYEF